MTPVGGETSVAGIVGWPVSGSLSPAIHNAAFAARGLDWVYVALPVAPESLAAAVAGARALGIRALNVTMPHKVQIMAHLDDLTPAARRIGAVNTLVREEDRFTGDNTDGEGFLRFLAQEAGMAVQEKRALVLGAGGAARALCAALAGAGARVEVAARRAEAAAALASEFEDCRAVPWSAAAAAAAGAHLLVNATPVLEGLPVVEDAATPSLAPMAEGGAVVDLIYGRPPTPLLRAARTAGIAAFDGIGMLVHQAALAFERWTGERAPLEAMADAARRASSRDSAAS